MQNSPDYTRFLSTAAARRQPSAIREATQLFARSPPSTISFAAGNPNVALFPFKEATITLKDDTTIQLDSSDMSKALQYLPTPGQADLLEWLRKLQVRYHSPIDFKRYELCVTNGSMEGLSKVFELVLNTTESILVDSPCYSGSSDMSKALQYLPTPGQADLLEWLRKLQVRYHSPIDFKRYELCVTNGSMEGLSKVFELVLNTTESILVDSPCYSGSLDFLRGFGANIISINTDSNGMSAEYLDNILSNWSDLNTLPRVLYTIPNGSNPTGASMSLERKKDIYNIAQKYNLLIIEDDPYFFLQFKKLVPSFLSMDTDGRVIRLDSMSKVLSGGMRLGFFTAPIPLWQKLVYHQQVTSLHASSLSQMVALKLFEKWGLSGFHQHTEQISKFYENQKNLMVNAIKKHLNDMVTFNEPTAGMFIWMKINGIDDTRKLIYEKALEQEVLLLPGSAFFSDQSKTYPYVRVSYSVCTPEQIETGMARFGKVLREELHK
ncbi:unnamed protein product [Adineta steineri]|uniref:Aminotransferase class I/classII large domain-containing protein n=4 Tax=Adineta steineri TaxID=433720 RepID=A0A813SJN5_9BILA|nr:unnamed protein product [Adineta steineri]